MARSVVSQVTSPPSGLSLVGKALRSSISGMPHIPLKHSFAATVANTLFVIFTAITTTTPFTLTCTRHAIAAVVAIGTFGFAIVSRYSDGTWVAAAILEGFCGGFADSFEMFKLTCAVRWRCLHRYSGT